jgi:NTE family protein
MIRPSRDVGELAATHAQSPHLKSLGGLTGRALRYLMKHPGEADLLSYLLFDGEFLAPLAELGFSDARSREEELCRFFTD